MKLRNLFLGLSASLAVLAGCDKLTDVQQAESLPVANEADVTELSFEDPSNASKEFKLYSTRAWKVENTASWISVSPEKGPASTEKQTIRVTVMENTGANRSATIKFTNGFSDCDVIITVSQVGPEGETDGTVTVQEFIEMADTQNYYKLKGTVSRFNSQYCSFDLTDETGTIYVYSVTQESKDEWTSKIKNGGTIVIQGKYEFYADKNQHEVVNAIIESFEEGAPVEATDVTVAEFNAAPVDASKYYRLRGTVGGPINTTYGNFDLIDETGTVYVYGISNWSEYSSKVAEGGSIVVVGTRGDYNGKIEVLNGTIESYDGEGSEEGGEVTPPVEKPESLTKATIAEFLAAEVSTEVWYELTGKIKSIASATYGNFTIEDETGSVSIYGMTSEWVGSNDQSFAELNLNAGDVVTLGTLRAEFNGTAQGGGSYAPAYYISHVDGEPDPVTLSHTLTSNVTWTVDENKKSYDNEVIVNGTNYKALKLGTSKLIGEATITVPQGATKLSFYGCAWNGKAGTVEFYNGTTKLDSIELVSNPGCNNNSPFTLTTVSDDDWYTVDLGGALASETVLTVKTVSNAFRVVLFGVNAE